MGRQAIYKNEEERREAKRESNRKWREKQGGSTTRRAKKGKPKSWLKQLDAKLDAADSNVSDGALPSGKGEPFADLPPLNLGGASPAETSSEGEPSTSDAGDSSATGASGGASSAPSDKTSTPAEPFADPELLAAMAGDAIEMYVNATGAYAVAEGFIAFGPDAAKLANKATQILVKKYGREMGLSDEEGAAWIVGGIVGANSVQAFRAKRAVDAKKEEEKKNAPRAASNIVRVQSGPNGAPAAEGPVPNAPGPRPPSHAVW